MGFGGHFIPLSMITPCYRRELTAPKRNASKRDAPQNAYFEPDFPVFTSVPKGPSRTKNTTESEFGTGSKFATEVAKRF